MSETCLQCGAPNTVENSDFCRDTCKNNYFSVLIPNGPASPNIWPYWHQYCHLQNEFISTFDFVELCEDNLKVYSPKFCSLLMSIGAEIELACREITGLPKANMPNLRKSLASKFQLSNASLIVPRLRSYVWPFKGIDPIADRPLAWWSAYNDLKHSRAGNSMRSGNLENCLQGLGALCLLNLIILEPVSSLFYFESATSSDFTPTVDHFLAYDREISKVYQLFQPTGIVSTTEARNHGLVRVLLIPRQVKIT